MTATVWTLESGERGLPGYGRNVPKPGVGTHCTQPRPGAFSLHNQQPRHIVPCPSRPAAQSGVLSSSAAITDQMNALQGRGHTSLVLLLSAFSFNQPILSEIIRSLCTICCRISCAVWRVSPNTAQLATPPVTQPSWLCGCGCQACCSGVPSSHSSDQFVFVNVGVAEFTSVHYPKDRTQI